MQTSPFLVQRIVWAVLTASQLIYFLLLNIISQGRVSGAALGALPNYSTTFAGIACALGVASITLHLSARKKLALTMEERARGELPALEAKIRKATPFMIISLMLNEAVCLTGFTLGMSARNAMYMLPYVAASLLLNAVMFPRYSQQN